MLRTSIADDDMMFWITFLRFVALQHYIVYGKLKNNSFCENYLKFAKMMIKGEESVG